MIQVIARALSLLDMVYDVAGPIAQGVAVVYSNTEDGFAALPSGQNAANFLGFSVIAGSGPVAGAWGYQKIAVRRLGVAMAVSNGAIAYGDRLIIASAAGDVLSVEAEIEAGTNPLLYVIGRAENSTTASGQQVGVFVDPQIIAAG